VEIKGYSFWTAVVIPGKLVHQHLCGVKVPPKKISRAGVGPSCLIDVDNTLVPKKSPALAPEIIDNH